MIVPVPFMFTLKRVLLIREMWLKKVLLLLLFAVTKANVNALNASVNP